MFIGSQQGNSCRSKICYVICAVQWESGDNHVNVPFVTEQFTIVVHCNTLFASVAGLELLLCW